MPKITYNRVERGNLFFEFKEQVTKPFYGNPNPLTEFEVFKRYGVLPHHNLANLKLINILGAQLLKREIKNGHLEEQISKLETNPQEHASEIEQLRQKQLFESLERLGNAMTIDVLYAMSPLEKRLNPPASLSADELSKLQTDIKAIFKSYIEQFDAIEEHLAKQGLTTYANSLSQIRDELFSQRSLYLGIFKQFEKQLTHEGLRDLYNQVIDDYEQIQKGISSVQRPYLANLETKNSSAKLVVPSLEKSLNTHSFSMMNPTDEQLWEMKDGTISTELLSKVNEIDALTVACLIDSDPKEFVSHFEKKANAFRIEQLEHKNGVKFKFSSLNKSETPNFDAFAIKSSEKFLNPGAVLNQQDQTIFCFMAEVGLNFAHSFECFEKQNPELVAGILLTAASALIVAAAGHIHSLPSITTKITDLLSELVRLNPSTGISTRELSFLSEHMLHESISFFNSESASLYNLLTAEHLSSVELSTAFLYGVTDLSSKSNKIAEILNIVSPETLKGKDSYSVAKTILENMSKLVLVISMIYGISLAEQLDSSEKVSILEIPKEMSNKNIQTGYALNELHAMAKFLQFTPSVFSNMPVEITQLALSKRFTLPDSAEDTPDEKNALRYMYKLLIFSKIAPIKFQEWLGEHSINLKTIKDFRNACDKHLLIAEAFEQYDFIQQLNQAYEARYPDEEKSIVQKTTDFLSLSKDKIVQFVSSDSADDSPGIFSQFINRLALPFFKKIIAPPLAFLAMPIVLGVVGVASIFTDKSLSENYSDLLKSGFGLSAVKFMLLLVSLIKTAFKLVKAVFNSFYQTLQKLLFATLNTVFNVGAWLFGIIRLVISLDANLFVSSSKLLLNLALFGLVYPLFELVAFSYALVASVAKFWYWLTGQSKEYVNCPRFSEARKDFLEDSYLETIRMNVSECEIDLAKKENCHDAIILRDNVVYVMIRSVFSSLENLFAKVLNKVDQLFFWNLKEFVQANEYESPLAATNDQMIGDINKKIKSLGKQDHDSYDDMIPLINGQSPENSSHVFDDEEINIKKAQAYKLDLSILNEESDDSHNSSVPLNKDKPN